MSRGTDPRDDAELLAVVAAFVLRARRVLAHSLCDDVDALTRVADGAWVVTHADNVESVERSLPPEELVESLAARVRPVLLRDDGIHYESVLTALSAFLARHGHIDESKWCRELKKDWRAVDFKGGAVGYHISKFTEGVEVASAALADTALANAWFYGDLVHADQAEIELGGEFDIAHRFAAAAVRTAQAAILIRDTHSFIVFLGEEGLLPLNFDTLNAIPVQVKQQDLQLARILTAPLGTEISESLVDPDKSDWQSVNISSENGRWAMRIPWGRND